MTIIGFHASHEQVHPSALLSAVQAAEQAGFDAAMCSDHLAPWSERQGHSGFAWAWLGAALATTSLPFGVVNAPGQRYHPAIVAQAAATLAAMFPGRFWVALGSGENANEHVTGDPWPTKDVRDARLLESVDVIRRLLAGQEVTHRGLVQVDRARVWTLPTEPPALIGPAVTPATAARAATWADGLITINQPIATLREIVAAYRDHGGRGPLAIQVHLAWHEDQAEAERIAFDQWRSNVFPPPVCWDLATPEHFDVASRHTRPEDVAESVLISADTGRHVEYLAGLVELGFEHLYLHHVGQEQRPFIDRFGADVLPALRGAA
ncbi:TIGR03885 family FMN-dependent LLM class oxidoreductase [Actinotalea fermentans]|uniref:LLM class F420-dependent oxidoreductase n=1 Tax=Actinotalea fermentans TaxID=43671 RepID=A0A511YUQ3_9CELL|nr:TIGR03885 family FMN-dependent LLM class oxidoreductase [Actinotalea fermentans]KGM17464.1 5,10-methylene tetrahydromethanopterin reductase [Actinotalea fermentans ATCC 43279 = JCM 9966 = DSM 3133]GEN78923.1 LLM class F420-dependent oxidoreductase [Actinotalea fermentans]